jgi:1,4-alpha-glucan branching enzyme
MPKYEDVHFVDTKQAVWNYSLFTDEDVHNFQNGTHYSLYTLFGNKQIEVSGKKGTYFAVWAPNATAVYVKGNFNDWNNESHLLKVRQDSSGIWEGFIPGILAGEVYKYHIHGYKGVKLDKGDPFAHYWELRPLTASITWQTNYNWKDTKWIEQRKIKNRTDQPYSVYEVHLASWMRPDKNNEDSYNSYTQLISLLVPYVKEMGFTHVEFMPIMEHPFDGSWGYQGVGFFAPTSRFGNPQEFAALVEAFHTAEIGVIVDWVPSHFPYDAHGLFMFDGTNTYEYADMRKGYHPDWNSYIFNYKRGEVKSFLISSARFWCDQFHIDGLRVDAVSSMLKLDYSREEGEWEPNEFGGNGNIEAIAFIKDLNETLYRDFPYIQTIAEEASDWPGISKPTFMDGLGFGMKWMMGWMHDTLDYFKLDPLFRSLHQDKFSFSMMYFYDESFMLPLSHDEVVHGKSPMIYKMPGDDWQKFANLRLLYTYMFMHPGAKLLFMGNEFAATKEWNYTTELQWDLLQIESHAGMRKTVQALNEIYKNNPALFELQFDPKGFEWVEINKREEAVIAFKRKGLKPENDILIVMNMTPVPRHQFPIHVQGKKVWSEIFNSDSKKFGGAGDLTNTGIQSTPQDEKGDWNQLLLNLPALSAIVLA